MVKRNVIWTRTADIQFAGILEYWVKRNKSNTYSKKLVKLISERTKQIADRPLIYKATDFKNVRVASMLIHATTAQEVATHLLVISRGFGTFSTF